MEDDVLKLPSFTPTQQAVTELQRYERDDIIVTDASGKAIGIVTDQDILNKKRGTGCRIQIDACRMFRLDFSPYEFKKNPVTSNMTVVRYIPVAVTVLEWLQQLRELE